MRLWTWQDKAFNLADRTQKVRSLEFSVYYNTPQNLDQGLRWIRCLNGKSIQETNDGEQA